MVRMGTTEWIVAAVAAALLLLVGAAFLFTRLIEKKVGRSVGMLYVDPEETAPGDGVYTLFYEDPKAFTDGTVVTLNVKVVRK